MRLLCSAWPRNLKTYGFCTSGEQLIGWKLDFPPEIDPKPQESNIQNVKFFPGVLYMYFAWIFCLETSSSALSSQMPSFYEEKNLVLGKTSHQNKETPCNIWEGLNHIFFGSLFLMFFSGMQGLDDQNRHLKL